MSAGRELTRSGVAADDRSSSLSAKPISYPDAVYQRSRISLRIGKRTKLSGEAKFTSGGLLAIGGLVSAILLSTSVLVRTAVRESRR